MAVSPERKRPEWKIRRRTMLRVGNLPTKMMFSGRVAKGAKELNMMKNPAKPQLKLRIKDTFLLSREIELWQLTNYLRKQAEEVGPYVRHPQEGILQKEVEEGI